jgi:hypothetical protein
MDQNFKSVKQGINSLKKMLDTLDSAVISLENKNKEINDTSDSSQSSQCLYEQVPIYDDWIEIYIGANKVYCVLSPDHEGVVLPACFSKQYPLNVNPEGIFENFTFKMGAVEFNTPAQVSDYCPMVIISSSYLKQNSIYTIFASLDILLISTLNLEKYEALEIRKLGAINPDVDTFINQCNSEPDLFSLLKKLFTGSTSLQEKLHQKSSGLKGPNNKRFFSETFSQEE